MLLSAKSLANKPKLYFTHGLLPRRIEPSQPPHAQKPFSTILRTPNIHTVELVFPKEVDASITSLLNDVSISTASYYAVTLPLAALLEPPFLSTCIKGTAPVTMLSKPEPGPGSAHYSLEEGVLRLELSKELYERCGLVGKPIVAPGTSPHLKQRFLVERSLRSASMARGKKGFERLRRACTQVLTEPVRWILYCPTRVEQVKNGRVVEKSEPADPKRLIDALSEYNVEQRTATPVLASMDNVQIPSFALWSSSAEQKEELLLEDATDLLDWLGSVSIASDRLDSSDRIDPFLSRWTVPNPPTATSGALVRVRWSGFLQPEWIQRLFLALLRDSETKSGVWFALSARTMGKKDRDDLDGYTILRSRMDNVEPRYQKGQPGTVKMGQRAEFLLWEMHDCINV